MSSGFSLFADLVKESAVTATDLGSVGCAEYNCGGFETLIQGFVEHIRTRW